MAHDVFISYSHRDRTVADAACARLEQAGHRCWIAPRDVGPGEWGKAIVDGINGARVFVLIFSTHANRSPQVNREVERAVSKGLPIIPVRIERINPSDALEYFISNQHWLDAMTPPLARHLERLSEMVGRLLGGPAPSPERPVAAPAPARRRRWPVAVAALIAAAGIAGFVYRWPQSSPVEAGPAILLDFRTAGANTAVNNRVAAAPYLHEAAVPVRVVETVPQGSRLQFIANSELYGGNAVRPTFSESFLTLDVPEVVPSEFTIEFERPLAELSFTVPALFAASEHGIIFPAFRATAYDASGALLDQIGRSLRRSFRDVAAETITLRAPGPRGIVRVAFHSDPEGRAAFRALLIERMTYRSMEAPGR